MAKVLKRSGISNPTQFKIEKGVPLPKRNGGLDPIYPFELMEIGDSFVVESHYGNQIAAVANKRRAPKHFR